MSQWSKIGKIVQYQIIKRVTVGLIKSRPMIFSKLMASLISFSFFGGYLFKNTFILNFEAFALYLLSLQDI